MGLPLAALIFLRRTLEVRKLQEEKVLATLEVLVTEATAIATIMFLAAEGGGSAAQVARSWPGVKALLEVEALLILLSHTCSTSKV